ncbi:S1C family serine protease [Herbaspirillum sp. SJZ107]|uniref:S1C family serine protease n=1 Tax=Herbaspirillum sp. SJZ107 TaxID=2572881 RepID=UPI001154C2AC|nr:S1C family serine protease [Herbaspirillum sp. SJZ107]TQK05065.1 S1-C subfamily serine protease [Herbaspirillum sp. SJZ107]
MKIVRLAAVSLPFALACAGFAAHAQDAGQIPMPTSGTPAAPSKAIAPPTVAAASPAVENSVVKIFSSLRRPDPYKPWTKATPQEVTGSGVVIEGKRILTNAHVVGYASQVQVQASQDGDKIGATVVAIAPGMDLAVLKLDDESFFDKHKPVPRASVLPDVREAVMAYGYPLGGNSLSITKGIVSRVEFVPYFGGNAGLRVQIDAPINPGNSGGPVIAGDKMIGLAYMVAANAQNIGYVIPNEEVELFLRDVADGRYDGKPQLVDDVQTLENPVLRQYLKLDKSVEGALVHRPARSDAAYPLKEWDIITRVGDYPVDNQGMVKLGPNLRVRFQYRVQQVARDGKVPLTIVRDGRPLQVQVPVGNRRGMLIPSLDGSYPSYFVYGPIVFSRATNEFLAALNANAATMNAMSYLGSPLVTRRGDEPDAQHEELVVISSPFFPHKLVAGYSNRFGAVVESVNGVPVRSLRHLVSLLRDQKDELIVLRFAQRAGETMVLPRKAMLEATEGVLSDNGIRSQGSPDMMDVWNGKKL